MISILIVIMVHVFLFRFYLPAVQYHVVL